MNARQRIVRVGSVAVAGLGLVWACGFDDTLREYLSARFWLPFAKGPGSFAKAHTRRMSKAYAGMTAAAGDKPLDKLRAAYQQIANGVAAGYDEGLAPASAGGRGWRPVSGSAGAGRSAADRRQDRYAGG